MHTMLMGTISPRRLRVLGCAVAVLTLVVGCGNGPEPTPITPAAPTTPPPVLVTPTPDPDEVATPVPSPVVEQTLAPAEEPPAQWVGVTHDHRLVVIDTASGEEVAVLGEFDDPDDFGGEDQEPFAAGVFITSAAVSADGFTVYYETCCEPAPNIVWEVPIEGGEESRVLEGAWPAVSADGSMLAAVVLQWVAVVDLSDGEVSPFLPPEEDDDAEPDGPVALRHPTWSPDGESVVFERYDELDEAGLLARLDLAGTFADAEPVPGSEGVDYTLPSFDAAGRLHVVEQRWRPWDVEPAGSASGVVLDPEDGDVVERHDYPTGVTSHAHDARGSFLIVTFADGTVVWQQPDGEREVLGTGYTAAAW